MHTTRRLATAVMLAGTSLSIATPAQAVPGVPANVFDPISVGSYSFHDQTSAQFAATYTTMKKDYLPTDLEIDVDGATSIDDPFKDGYRVGSVWQRNTDGRRWLEKRDLTGAGFEKVWKTAKDDGLRLVEQETYYLDGTRLYAGIWIENREHLNWTSHRGESPAEFSVSYKAHKKAGLMPADYDVFLTKQGVRIATVWVAKPAGTNWSLHTWLSSAQFKSWYTSHKAHERLIAFESYPWITGQTYAGIWVTNQDNRGWGEARDLTRTGYANLWHRYKDLGYRVVGMDRYDTADGTRYALIFRQNTTRPNWPFRKWVDTRVQQELDKGAPGISVAVYQNGVPVYLRGFGKANIDDGIWMDADHVGSIASVSKAVAGVLAVRLQRLGYIDLDDKTRDWVPTMPPHHTHTLRQLVNNRGCVEHYKDGGDDADVDEDTYDTALEAAEEFWDDPLVCTPGTYHYSTHGYTLLAAALENAVGMPIKQMVRTFLTNPYHLGTLGPQNFSSSAHRMTPYEDGTSDPDPTTAPNNDWKVLGGGLDSSATDLAAFGSKLIGGQILNSADRTELWTAPDTSAKYGLGWNLGTESGTQLVAKDGSQTGTLAYLRLYPQKGISVAVMINRRNGTWSAYWLGRAIGTKVLSGKP